MSTTRKLPISALSVVTKAHSLQHNLTPDPLTPSHSEFKQILKSNPSVQRRARLVDSSAHFSFVTPLHLSFPYQIEGPEDEKEQEVDKAAYIERWLSEREPLEERAAIDTGIHGVLRKYSALKRETDYSRNLMGLSASGLNDCLPQLDVGDAFSHLGAPSLQPPVSAERPQSPTKSDSIGVSIRQELIDILSGHSVLMSHANDPQMRIPYLPWSLRYSGHQFGVWAGQLGDGRAISILETPHPEDNDLQYEIQLKGAGRTPYSRGADGLAVLRSSIREYLCAEAMHALSIPTTRSLSLIHVPELPVRRETTESAAVVARMALSFIRIGSFQAQNPPQELFFLGMGGGQQKPDYEGLRILGEWVTGRVLKLPRESEDEPWGKTLVWECARRNAKMVAGWQAYGFMHGVMNTDNISIMGLTMDYGPYAFMDVYDKDHICNHTDQEGRYAYKYQPTMIIFALRALLTALGPLIGAELTTNCAVKQGWAASASQETIEDWSEKAAELRDSLDEVVQDVFQEEYWKLMRNRLGMRTSAPSDAEEIINPFLKQLEDHVLDFHKAFRMLSSFSPSAFVIENGQGSDVYWDSFVTKFLSLRSSSPAVADSDHEAAMTNLKAWFDGYAKRILEEKDIWLSQSGQTPDVNEDSWEQVRAEDMRKKNPRFVLRQWILEEVIKKCEDNPDRGKKILAKVMNMVVNPFEPWGAEFSEEEPSDAEVKEERRYCDIGSKDMLGFQCSCSS